jgi:hypothetical protein
METFIKMWLGRNKNYELCRSDCQTFAREFASYLGVDLDLIPIRDGTPKTDGEGFSIFHNDCQNKVTLKVYHAHDHVQWIPQVDRTIRPGERTWVVGKAGASAESCRVKDFPVHLISGAQKRSFRFKSGEHLRWNGKDLLVEAS